MSPRHSISGVPCICALKAVVDEIDAAATDSHDALVMVMHPLSTLAIDFDHVRHDLRHVEEVHDGHIVRDDTLL